MNTKLIKSLHILYLAVLVAALCYAVFCTGLAQRDHSAFDWADNWHTPDNRTISTDDISAGSDGVTVVKHLPDDIMPNSSLCFVARNISFEVSIGDTPVLEYAASENPTGMGYGSVSHCVPLLPEYAEKAVTIRLGSVFDEDGLDTGGTGYIKNVCICPEKDYDAMLIRAAFIPALLSFVIIFFGILLSCIYFAIPGKDQLPFNMAALGLMAILLGMWCLIETGFMQLITGSTIGFRVLEYVLVIFVEYPTLVFVNSYSQLKKPLYTKIIFAFWIVSVLSFVSLRFMLRIDMHTLLPFYTVSYGLVLAFLAYIIVEDIRYCRAGNIIRNRRFFVTGAIIFTICSVIEIISIVSGRDLIVTNGNLLRIGLAVFFFEMLMQFLYWWAAEQKGKEQLIKFGFNDMMTGTGNRRAFEQYVNTGLDRNGTYGYVMCDINGLKQMNDREGHDAGDALIKDVADCLIEVFGSKRVYRLGGDEFVAVTGDTENDAFASKITSLRSKLSEKDRSVSIGAVFVEGGNMEYNEVRKTADKLMYDEKERFYKGRNERRRR